MLQAVAGSTFPLLLWRVFAVFVLLLRSFGELHDLQVIVGEDADRKMQSSCGQLSGIQNWLSVPTA